LGWEKQPGLITRWPKQAVRGTDIHKNEWKGQNVEKGWKPQTCEGLDVLQEKQLVARASHCGGCSMSHPGMNGGLVVLMRAYQISQQAEKRKLNLTIKWT
jgi:hypothetical protein